MSRGTLRRLRPLASIAVAALLAAGCARFTEHRVGLVDGKLTRCPQWPRCVSSQARDPDKFVKPYRLHDDTDATWRKAKNAVAAMPRTTIVDERAHYIRAEVLSPWGFYTDDLELLLKPDERVVQVRSTGRVGYYDFNVNRDRVEALRAELVKRGVVESSAD